MRKRIGGYTDFGPIQIPPRPTLIILTDRDDGTEWLVSFNTTEPMRLSITDVFSTIQRIQGGRVYAADDGPYMDQNGEYRLFVRGGRIGLDYTPNHISIKDTDQAPLYSRLSANQERLILDQSSPDPLKVYIGIETDD